MRGKAFFNSKLVTVFATLFIVALGYGVILPVLPFYTERLALGAGATDESIIFHIGFLTSIFPFFQMEEISISRFCLIQDRGYVLFDSIL